MSALHVILPIPTGMNGSGSRRGAYAIATVRGVPRLVSSRAARQWKADAVLLVSVKARQEGWVTPAGRLRLAVLRSDKHDLDSGVKLLCDAVAEGIGVDDARFGQVSLTRAASCRADCLLVIVEGMDD
jgi:Holliday junction resolvase RusA-like endonuclease